MDLERTFHKLLGLDERWEVCGLEFSEKEDRFCMTIVETSQLWPKENCPDCDSSGITCHDHAPTRSWRHMDVFGKRMEILCDVPRGRCPQCRKVYRVKVPWEGKGKHFTQEFEGFALALMREMPVSKASEIIDETDKRMWRMLHAHVAAAYAKLDMSDVVWIGADEMNIRKGHNYLTVFADLQKRRVLFATEGKDADTFWAFVQALLAHNGHPQAITHAALDMSPAYQKGARENLANAQVVFDKFHVIAQVNDGVDKVRRMESRAADRDTADQLKGNRWIFRKNPQNLSLKQRSRLEELDLENLATGLAYQMRLNLQEIYRSRTAQAAERGFGKWCRWVKRRAKRFGDLMTPMIKVAEMVESHLSGILAHWEQGLTTAYLEGLNSLYSATKRKARGYRNTNTMITMLYFVAGKLSIPAKSSH